MGNHLDSVSPRILFVTLLIPGFFYNAVVFLYIQPTKTLIFVESEHNRIPRSDTLSVRFCNKIINNKIPILLTLGPPNLPYNDSVSRSTSLSLTRNLKTEVCINRKGVAGTQKKPHPEVSVIHVKKIRDTFHLSKKL